MSEEAAALRVENAVARIRGLIQRASTADIGGRCFIDNLNAANGLPPRYRLSSPAKQQSFLLSLALATPEPAEQDSLSEDEWTQVYESFEEAFVAYMELFWPDSAELEDLSAEWHSVRKVAMPAFLDYFNTGLLATVEQIREQIQRYVVPFDDVLVGLIGISASGALKIAEQIQEDLAETIRQMGDLSQQLEEIREQAQRIARSRGEAGTSDQIAADELGGREVATRLYEATSLVGLASAEELRVEFRLDADAYLAAFTASRGSLPEIHYPTEVHAWESKALIQTEDEKFLVPSANGLFTSILIASERALSRSASREAYFSRRDRELEKHTADLLARLFPQATIWPGLYESADNQFEHDLVVLVDDTVLFVEVKASPPIEPFRDPDRAFLRLSRAFHSDKGIQHAFEQGERLRCRLDRGERVELFDEEGEVALVLEPSDLTRRISVSVTRDHFGPLATDLALLLEKGEEDPYPWVTNVLDLGSMADAWDFLGWGADEFFLFIRWRVLCHGKVFGTDELEYVGYHIRHGSLKSAVEAGADVMQLNPSYSDFFDQLYNYRHFDGEPPSTEVTNPVTMDLRESLRAGEPMFVSSERSRSSSTR